MSYRQERLKHALGYTSSHHENRAQGLATGKPTRLYTSRLNAGPYMLTEATKLGLNRNRRECTTAPLEFMNATAIEE